MTRYLAIIEQEQEQSVFFVSFPDAPGCVAEGATQDEALDNAAEALSEWMADEAAEGRSAPAARSYVELLQAAEYGLGQGAMVAWVPLLLDTGKLVRANISMDAGLLASIDEAAARRGVTRSAFLVSAARDKIKAGA